MLRRTSLGADDAQSHRPRSQSSLDHRLGRLQRDLGARAPEEYKKDGDTQKWVGDMVQAIRTLRPDPAGRGQLAL